jgi:hypothetical protein
MSIRPSGQNCSKIPNFPNASPIYADGRIRILADNFDGSNADRRLCAAVGRVRFSRVRHHLGVMLDQEATVFLNPMRELTARGSSPPSH